MSAAGELQVVVGSGAPLALGVACHALAEEITKRGLKVGLVEEDEDNGSRVRSGRREMPLAIDLSDGPTLMLGAGPGATRLPFPIGPSTFSFPRFDSGRVVWLGQGEDSRKLRMTLRTIAEWRRRRLRLLSAVCGPLPEEARGSADEEYRDISPPEAVALIRSSRAVLDCGDEESGSGALGLLAASLGAPVVTHRSAPLCRWGFGSIVIGVAERSADAFADALQLQRGGDPVDRRAGEAAATALLEVFGLDG